MKQQGKINRDDMLELTRRMTIKRNCFSRIAGAYYDEDGLVDGTFNRHFLKLTERERGENLEIAKTIPFSETNVELKEYLFEEQDKKPGSLWQLLMALKACNLKNDALLDTLYGFVSDRFIVEGPFAFYVFYGDYDIPLKGSDSESQWESEEVYSFLVGAFCPIEKDYEPEKPIAGFLFPAFRYRSKDEERIELFVKKGGESLLQLFF